jgi:iron-sulfur cluster repair protein YtfE (RIC family)
MNDTKALDQILSWKLDTLMDMAFPVITRSDFEQAAAELEQLKAERDEMRKMLQLILDYPEYGGTDPQLDLISAILAKYPGGEK